MKVMTTGWDKSKVDGAMHDIGRMYIRFYNDDPDPIREFLEKYQEYAVYIWQVCHYIRPEFPFDTKIELRAYKNHLVMEIHLAPDFVGDAVQKTFDASYKADCSARELDKDWKRNADLFSFTIL